MTRKIRRTALLLLLALAARGASAQTLPLPGENLQELLDIAREASPDYAAMLREADAAAERVQPAGALADPMLTTELRDLTKMGEQSPSLLPGRVGSTRYIIAQEVPWYGKRDLKREIAQLEADGAKGKAQGTWTEIAAGIKTAYAQLYAVQRNERLTREILDLMTRLEKVAQVRYAGGLAAQQDAIRAQVEQTAMRNELLAQEAERRTLQARLNALMARPINAPLAEPQALRPLPSVAALDPATLEDRVRSRNPLLFAEDARIRAAEKNRDLTYKNRYPDFKFGIAPIQYRNAIREWEVMIELNIPLQQSTRRSQESEANAMLSAARSRKEALANQVLGALSENLAAIDAARRTEALVSTSLLPQARLTFDSALASYETGKVDFATLLDAQRQIRVAQQNQLKAQTDAQMRLADIEKLIGEDL